MSIPVFERCDHKVRDVSPAKAQHWLRTKPSEYVPKVDGHLDQGLQLTRCLIHIDIPYDLVAATLAATQAPTRRRIHPWLEEDTAEAIIRADLATRTDQDHHLVFTAKGREALQYTYAHLLHEDLDRGLELLGAFTSVLRDAVRATPWASGEQSWQKTLQTAWEGATTMPAPYQEFRDHLKGVPEKMVKFLVHVEPWTAERLLREAL